MIHNSIKVKDRDGLLELYLSGRPIRKARQQTVHPTRCVLTASRLQVEVTGVVVSKAVMSTRANLGEGVKGVAVNRRPVARLLFIPHEPVLAGSDLPGGRSHRHRGVHEIPRYI